MTLPPRRLGIEGPVLFPLGQGCMGLSDLYGPADEGESIATIHAALDAGITLLDTGDYYRAGHNELLIGRALEGRRDRAVVSVKFGALRGPDGSWLGMDTRPAAMKTFLAYTLMRLGLDHVDIYRPGRLDPHVPIEETVGAMAEMVTADYIRWIGLSEVGPDTIRRAHAVHPVVDLQIEYSLVSRGPEERILPLAGTSGLHAATRNCSLKSNASAVPLASRIETTAKARRVLFLVMVVSFRLVPVPWCPEATGIPVRGQGGNRIRRSFGGAPYPGRVRLPYRAAHSFWR